jgi:hypothetical protein
VKPPTVDVLDSLPDRIVLRVRTRNLWRARLGMWLLGLASLLLKSRCTAEREPPP